MTTIAMIGLGKMGGHMANHAVRAGHQIRVFDVSPAAMAEPVSLGATAASSPAEAARGADIVGLVVFDDAQVKDVVAGSNGVLGALEPGAVVVVNTTVKLATIRELAGPLADRGIGLVDAGISGGESGAENGTLVTMVGGESATVAKAKPLLDAYSREIVHAGPLGAGMALKLARNAVGYTMMSAVHESMQLAEAAGIDQEVLAHVLRETDVASMAMAPLGFGGAGLAGPELPAKLRSMLEHTRDLGDKDLDQALALAADLQLKLPVTAATRKTFHLAVRMPNATDSRS